MKIEFIENKMVITHPSGHVDTYDKKHLTEIKEDWVRNREEISKQIKTIEEDISKL